MASKLLDLVMIYFFYRYVRITLDFKGKLASWADKGIPILMAVQTLVTLSNIVYPLTFWVDANGGWSRSSSASEHRDRPFPRRPQGSCPSRIRPKRKPRR